VTEQHGDRTSPPPPLSSSSGLPDPPAADVPLYVISVAAELSGLHPQTLRTYDRLGLVSPGRTGGGGRRYSWQDVQVLREIAHLTAAGIGLEGVRRILLLEARLSGMQQRVRELEDELAATRYALSSAVADQGSSRNLPAVTRRPVQSLVVWHGR
jgi:MerR family transcriptional regulator, heat shock protein HspR